MLFCNLRLVELRLGRLRRVALLELGGVLLVELGRNLSVVLLSLLLLLLLLLLWVLH